VAGMKESEGEGEADLRTVDVGRQSETKVQMVSHLLGDKAPAGG